LEELTPKRQVKTTNLSNMTIKEWPDLRDMVHVSSTKHVGRSGTLVQRARLAHDTMAKEHMLPDILDERDRIPIGYSAVPTCHCFAFLDCNYCARHIPTQCST